MQGEDTYLKVCMCMYMYKNPLPLWKEFLHGYLPFFFSLKNISGSKRGTTIWYICLSCRRPGFTSKHCMPPRIRNISEHSRLGSQTKGNKMKEKKTQNNQTNKTLGDFFLITAHRDLAILLSHEFLCLRIFCL